MATRTRTRGSLIPPTVTSNGSISYAGSFKGADGLIRSNRVDPIGSSSGAWQDTRASITDETGSNGTLHNCTNGQTIAPFGEGPRMKVVMTGAPPNTGVMTTEMTGDALFGHSYNFVTVNSLHNSMPDGSNIALARVPSMSKELLSGLNSLYELKDCWQLLSLIPVHFLWAAARGKKAESVRAFKTWWAEVSSFTSSPAAAMAAVGSASLAWDFGIKPLLRDIENVHKSLDRMNDIVRELLNKRFSVAGKFTDTNRVRYTHASTIPSGFGSCFTADYYTVQTTTKTWVYGARKRLDPSKFPSINTAKLRALTESLGLSLDVTDVWEAVPFSFVWDWFIPIQTFLEQFKDLEKDPSWLLTDGWWSSVKTTSVREHTAVWQPRLSANYSVTVTSGLTHLHVTTRKDYQRTRLTTAPTGFPSIYIPELDLPSVDRASTSIKLALQRIQRVVGKPGRKIRN